MTDWIIILLLVVLGGFIGRIIGDWMFSTRIGHKFAVWLFWGRKL